MNFFGVGPMEVLLIAVIAVVVLGPERFPELAVQVARAIKYLRGYANDATSELREEFQELTKEYESLRAELNEVRTGVTKDTAEVTGELRSASQQLQKAAGGVRPALQAPLDDILRDTKPIIEPGGELPPDRQAGGANGSNGVSH